MGSEWVYCYGSLDASEGSTEGSSKQHFSNSTLSWTTGALFKCKLSLSNKILGDN